MNLSRAAKKFRAQMPKEPEAPNRAQDKNKSKIPPITPALPLAVVSEPVVTVAPTPEPTPEPVVPAPAPQPKKSWPVKAKRPRFVREKAEKRERRAPATTPPRSTKFAARLLTVNLVMPPKDESMPR